jgi:hypothetical protein
MSGGNVATLDVADHELSITYANPSTLVKKYEKEIDEILSTRCNEHTDVVVDLHALSDSIYPNDDEEEEKNASTERGAMIALEQIGLPLFKLITEDPDEGDALWSYYTIPAKRVKKEL